MGGCPNHQAAGDECQCHPTQLHSQRGSCFLADFCGLAERFTGPLIFLGQPAAKKNQASEEEITKYPANSLLSDGQGGFKDQWVAQQGEHATHVAGCIEKIWIFCLGVIGPGKPSLK